MSLALCGSGPRQAAGSPSLPTHPSHRHHQPPAVRDISASATAAQQLNGGRLGFDLVPQLAASLTRAGQAHDAVPVLRSAAVGDARPADTAGKEYMEFPVRDSADSGASQPPLVRVRLSVPYRVHSRQMLCIGGSQIPFGWSFLSIAKVPMSWHLNDIWVAEVSTSCSELSCQWCAGHAFNNAAACSWSCRQRAELSTST